MAKRSPVFTKVKAICLALPETKLTMTWGKPHFRVGEKIFAGCNDDDDPPTIGFKLTKPHQGQLIKRPGFEKAKYVGRHGWVSMDASRVKDWDEVRALIHESYRLIAPKRLVRQVEPGS